MTLTRRELLVSGAGLLIAFHVPRKGRAAQMDKKPSVEPNAFVRVAPDDSVTVVLAHSEMGQGIWTSLAMLIAEEMDCDWSKIRVEHAPAAPAYAHTAYGLQMTGGSTTTWSEFDRYRTVGAMAREMLVRAAADRWKVRPRSLHTENGFVVYRTSRASYGQLAEAAQQLSPPASVRLKGKKDWKLIGKPTRRLDTPEKITGKAQFGIDVQLPRMRTALIARAPVFGGKVKSFDASKAKAVPGVEQVVQVPSGIAVVAANFWSAKLGRDALQIDWDPGPGAELNSGKLLASYREQAKGAGAVAVAEGDADTAIARAARRLEAEYDVPYLAHATMEPLNCTVRLERGRCEIWTGTQFQGVDQMAAAAIAGVPPQKVVIHTTFLGGGFGRRATLNSHFVAEGVHVAKAAGVAVKVVWTREDDIRGGHYRPMYVHRIEAGVDDKGTLLAWRHTIVGQSILTGTAFEKFTVKDGVDASSVEGAVDSPYLEAVPARRITLHSPRNQVPPQWFRSVGNSHTAFAMESMIDELAWAAGRDPLEYRRALLRHKPRHWRALKAAAEKAGWGTPPPEGRARGLAVHDCFGTIVAEVAEVSVDARRGIRVHKVSCALDCGQAVNPLAIEAQVQGGVVFGLSAALFGAVTLKEGRVEQSNFHDYRVLRIPEMPEVKVQILESDAKMGGIGEPATAPIAAAVANAVYALTRQRLRSLPLRLT